MSTTQVWTKESMQALLDKNDAAVVRAALAIYARQTAAEQSGAYTHVTNGIGFSKFDAEPMTRFVNAVNKGWRISPKWMNFARRRMKHYWRQLCEIANDGASTPAIAPDLHIESAAAPAAPTEVSRVRLCECEWADGEPGVTCPAKRPMCCTGGRVSIEHVDLEMKRMFAEHERKQEEAAFMSDPDLFPHPEARSWG